MASLDKTCEKTHERIVYFGDDCPLCRAKDVLTRLSDVLTDVHNPFLLGRPGSPMLQPKKQGKVLKFVQRSPKYVESDAPEPA